MKKLKVRRNATRLEKRVSGIINSKVENGYPLESVLEDLTRSGCESGMIGELIYTYDTVRFYKLYRADIEKLVTDLARNCGCGVDKLFRGWDAEDPLARDESNQNLLAWFGFEETARNLANENGVEL